MLGKDHLTKIILANFFTKLSRELRKKLGKIMEICAKNQWAHFDMSYLPDYQPIVESKDTGKLFGVNVLMC